MHQKTYKNSIAVDSVEHEMLELSQQHDAFNRDLNVDMIQETDYASHHDLMRLIAAQNPEAAEDILRNHKIKHPLAMEKQRELFSLRPTVFQFFVEIVVNKDHPFHRLKQYQTLLSLMTDLYPSVMADAEHVLFWERLLDAAVFNFANCQCVNEALKIEDQPLTFESHKQNKPVIEVRQTHAMEKEDVCYLDDVRVHGFIKPRHIKYIVEIASAYKYFLARKIDILKTLEPDPKLKVGLFNISLKVKYDPPIYIGFRSKNNRGKNSKTMKSCTGERVEGDFNDVVPTVCIHENCLVGKKGSCDLEKGTSYIDIKVDTVRLGDPPLGATNCVDMVAVEKALEVIKRHLARNNIHTAGKLPAVHLKYVMVCYLDENANMLSSPAGDDDDTAHLRALVDQYREMNAIDVEVMKKFKLPEFGMTGYFESNMRLEGSFHNVYNLFLPKTYEIL
ncbi:hypothetical protein L3Y34_010329 [Caenorhabditis briggsae]|uniref:Uncharacterized protein n=1 Tax=Caenorhabditis briggsae TaxID=6238 RepID=A0AAE8ZLC6_CAEBR|nr:hypothetical protein L3Y34_010329 [Caenorhabditis briggsae]